MADVAEHRDVLLAGAAVEVEPDQDAQVGSPAKRANRWDHILRRPDLDYSEIFAEDVGTLPGLSVWQIENFSPVEVDEGAYSLRKYFVCPPYVPLWRVFVEGGCGC